MSNYFVHESSYVDDGVEIGDNTKIWHFSHIQSGAKIGKDCVLGQNVNVAPDVSIGNNVKIQNNVSVYTGVQIEDDVFLGPSMVFTNIINPRSEVNRKDEFAPTLIKKGVSIGANATIVCGVTIGKYAFIGAGSVITKNVCDYELWYGVPAKRKGWMCVCGERLNEINITMNRFDCCIACGKTYEYSNGVLKIK